MSRRSRAVSDDSIATEVAEAHLQEGGSAIGAAAAGFFAAAAQRPGVLFAPLTVLLAAVVVGARALDGRHRQPGLGAKRPRGFLEREPIPPAARVAVPAGLSALLVALAYDDRFDLGSALAPALKIARSSGALRRAQLLERIGAVGARALSETSIRDALLAAGGPPEGGALTARDLEETAAVDHAAIETPEGELTRVDVPWPAPGPSEVSPRLVCHGLCAMDARGFAVALCYGEATSDDLEVPELEVRLVPSAIPVRRGVTRVPPAQPLPFAMTMQLWVAGGDPIEARIDPSSWSELRLRRDPRSRRVEIVRAARS